MLCCPYSAGADARRDWLDARAAGGRVVEAHGDLRILDRAGTRAKPYAWRAGEPDGGNIEHWMATARLALESARLSAR